MAWTDERVAKLRELWDKGLSASQIAKELAEGVTRNAVIGKAHRMNLASRPSPVKLDSRKKAKKPVEKKPASVKTKPAGGKVSLLELTERICKWPIGHPGEAGFHFCGKPSANAFPYCPEHCAQAYQVQQPRRDRRTNRGRISATPVR
ncbi:MAG: global cell cycle regulator GcrA-like protein [Alphaproteobacteria bacterium]|nr:global cell cycle regulator GcrA-like protein [Alphaproteobacteria bacterium]